MTGAPETNRLAVDIGGTFTDIVLETPHGMSSVKVLTTPAAPDDAVVSGMQEVLEKAGLAAPDIDVIVHGTTLATNAIIERKGALTALITTEGFRDVLEIGYESRFDQYDLFIEKPAPLVPRKLRFVVPERVDIRGRVLLELNEDAVKSLVPRLTEMGVESVAIGYLHSYANSDHERRTAEIIRDSLPDLSMTLSSDVCPEIREYERLTTAAANAYVRPLMERYLTRLAARVSEMGVRCPVLMMTSGGGLMSLDTARTQPIRLVESGPAGGAILAAQVAKELNLSNVISFDMGGTTAKICLIDQFTAKKAREFEVDRQARFRKGSGLPLRIPVIEMVEIGAGGGSIASVDSMNRITVGPESAGADPGPAAYDRGGKLATVTDADIQLGRIDPDTFAGGKVVLAPQESQSALQRHIGERLGLDVRFAAFGVTEIVDETMANATRVHAVEQGKSAGDYSLVAFGGAAPLHVGRLAEKLGVRQVVVPTHAGVGSAVGFLRAPVAYEVVRSMNMRLRDFDEQRVNDLFDHMRAEAMDVVRNGAPGVSFAEERLAYMRYLGQGHEIPVPLPSSPFDSSGGQIIQEAFDHEYRHMYARTLPNADIEVLTWGLNLKAPERAVDVVTELPNRSPAEPVGSRMLFDPAQEENVEIPLYWRLEMEAGSHVGGPAVIAEDETSTFVPKGFSAKIAANGYIIIDAETEATH